MALLTDWHFLLCLVIFLNCFILAVVLACAVKNEKKYPFSRGILKKDRDKFRLICCSSGRKYKPLLESGDFFRQVNSFLGSGSVSTFHFTFPDGSLKGFRFYPRKEEICFLSFPAEKEELLTAGELLEQIPFAVSIKDPENNYKYTAVNQLFSEITGLPKEKILGNSDETIAPSGASRSLAQDSSSILTGALLDIQEELRPANRRKLYFRLLKKPLRLNNGRCLLLSVFCDKTSDREMRARQESLVCRMNEQLQVCGMIHDLLTHLLTEPDFQKSLQIFCDFLKKSLAASDVLIYERSVFEPKQYICSYGLFSGKTVDFSSWPKPGNQEESLDFLFLPASEGNDPRYPSAVNFVPENTKCFSISFSDSAFPSPLLFAVLFDKERDPFSVSELYLLRNLLPVYRTLLVRSGRNIAEPAVPETDFVNEGTLSEQEAADVPVDLPDESGSTVS